MEFILFPKNPGVYFGFEVLVALGSLALLVLIMTIIGVVICKIKRHAFDEEECLQVVMGTLFVALVTFAGATTLLVYYN